MRSELEALTALTHESQREMDSMRTIHQRQIDDLERELDAKSLLFEHNESA